jgi:hypothetical protein
MSGTLQRKVATRTLPMMETVNHASPLLSSQVEEDIPETKKQRLYEPGESSANTDPAYATIALPASDDDDANTNEDPVTYTRRCYWTLEEDAKLTVAFANTRKRKWGKEYVSDFDAIAALVPGRSKKQCFSRWADFLDPSIDRTHRRTCDWTVDEDTKLKDAIQRHGGKNWDAIAASVPGRTRMQCQNRWHSSLHPSINRMSGRRCKWTVDEDRELKTAVDRLGAKNKWHAIAALLTGRTRKQCWSRWRDVMDPVIDRTAPRMGRWTIDEDNKLKRAAEMHGDKNWDVIAALIPGRITRQCRDRWYNVLDKEAVVSLAPSFESALENEVTAVAAMLPTQTTNIQWRTSNGESAWYPSISADEGSIDRKTICRRIGWTVDDDKALKDAIEKHNGNGNGRKKWGAISSLVPNRSKEQCRNRWNHIREQALRVVKTCI